MNPSSDTPTHVEIYKAFKGVKAVVHTHSKWAASWAQANRDIQQTMLDKHFLRKHGKNAYYGQNNNR